MLALPLLALAACGGAGLESAGSSAAPVANTPGNTAGSTDPYDQFVKPTEAKTYAGIGGTQQFSYSTDNRNVSSDPDVTEYVGQQAQAYGGGSSAVRSNEITVAYDPRDAVFTLTIADSENGAKTTSRFQDPANRTAFGGDVQPQWGTPDLSKAGAYANPNIQYLQAGEGSPLSPYQWSGSGYISNGSPTKAPEGGYEGSSYQSTSFFYEKPGTSTKYVTLAGYMNNRVSFSTADINGRPQKLDEYQLDRGAFAYGMLTDNNAVPTSGTASFSGNMLGSMVYNTKLDDGGAPTYFQWLSGTSKVNVDFGAKTVGLAVQGVVLAPQLDNYTSGEAPFITAGSTFAGNGSAKIDLVMKGGFAGSFEGGAFTFSAPKDTTFADGSKTAAVAIAGSNIDGAFYGPKANEVGGGFRVVGGVPDQRVDIVGAFTGKQ